MAELRCSRKVVKRLLWKLLENRLSPGCSVCGHSKLFWLIFLNAAVPALWNHHDFIYDCQRGGSEWFQHSSGTGNREGGQGGFSSVCYFDLFVALVMYGILYVAAPVIASFMELAELEAIVRVLSIVLFPGAVISVQTAYVPESGI